MKKFGMLGLALMICFMVALPATADTVNWTMWSNSFTTSSSAGSASGTSGAINVTYSGELEDLPFNYPSWGPAATFSGGTISNAPPSAGGILKLYGGASTAPIVNTITFSQAVTNPVMAIWSLGQGGINAQFVFGAAQPFTIESGGGSNEYGGLSIVSCNGGTTVCGVEGNGTIQFNGTFNSITFTNPVFENWYGFTVGTFEPTNSQVPEPSSIVLLVSGMGSLGLLRRKLIGR